MPQTKNDMVIMGANSESFQIPSLHSSLLIQRVYNILIYCWSLNKLHFNNNKKKYDEIPNSKNEWNEIHYSLSLTWRNKIQGKKNQQSPQILQ